MTWGWVIGWSLMGYGGFWAVLLFGWLLGMVYARYFVVLLASIAVTSLRVHVSICILRKIQIHNNRVFYYKGKTLMLNPPLLSPPIPYLPIPFDSSQQLPLLIQPPFILFLLEIHIRRRLIRLPLHLLQPTHLLNPTPLIQRPSHKLPRILIIRLEHPIATRRAAVIGFAFDLQVREGG